jgi:uncharacterized cupredoxin-like copper-binding protein
MDHKPQSQMGALMPTMLGVCVAMLACAGLLIVGLAVRPAGGLTVPKGSHVFHVTENEYGIQFPSGPIPSGNVVFIVTDKGTIPHELVVFQTKSATAPLPLRKNGEVDEESSQLSDVMDSGSALVPGETRILTATLDPGTYVAVCNLPTHYQFGMHIAFVVK